MTIAATASFATPPSYPSFSHQPRLLSYLLAAFCTVRRRWNDKWIYYARLNEAECPYRLKRHSRFMKKCTDYSVPCSFPCFLNFDRAARFYCVFPAFVIYSWPFCSKLSLTTEHPVLQFGYVSITTIDKHFACSDIFCESNVKLCRHSMNF